MLDDQEKIIQNPGHAADEAQEKYEDTTTNYFFLEAVEKHEKMAWIIRANLDGGRGSNLAPYLPFVLRNLSRRISRTSLKNKISC